MGVVYLLFCIVLLMIGKGTSNLITTPLMIQPGDFIVVGLFNIHGTIPNEPECTYPRSSTGVVEAHAMKYAIDTINKNHSFLTGYTIGWFIYDLCDVNDVQGVMRDFLVRIPLRQIIGIVGPMRSDDSSMTGVVASLYYKPVILLNDIPLHIDNRPNFQNVFYVVPHFDDLIEAIVEFVKSMEWNIVGLIYNDENYGIMAKTYLEILHDNNICLYEAHQINDDADANEYTDMMKNIFLPEKKLGVLLLFLDENEILKFAEGLEKIPLEEREHLNLVMSSRWGTNYMLLEKYKNVLSGLITFQPHHKDVKKYEEYLFQQNTATNTILKQVKKHTNCYGNDTYCKQVYQQSFGELSFSSASTIINSVYALMYYLDRGLKRFPDPAQFDLYGWHRVLKFGEMYKDNDTYPFNKTTFNFNAYNRIDTSRFDIFNLQQNGDEMKYERIGYWQTTYSTTGMIKPDFVLNKTAIQWRIKPAKSQCSSLCSAEQIKKVSSKFPECCWECLNCPTNHIILNNTCVSCGRSYKANHKQSMCEKLPVKQININITLKYFIYFICGLGISTTIIVALFFIRFRHTQVVKASSRELCTFIFIGIILLFLHPIIKMMKASDIICSIETVFIFIGFTSIFGPLMLKTNRIYRIIGVKRVSVVGPRVVSPLSQILMTLVLCCIHLLILLPVLKRAMIAYQYPTHQDYVEIYCTQDNLMMLINFGYVFTIMMAATFYAFKTRHFPKNYNESKYIGVTMYITCFILGICVVSYCLHTIIERKELVLVFLSSCSAIVVLVGLFAQKVYVIITKHILTDRSNEEKNSNPVIVANLQINWNNPIKSRTSSDSSVLSSTTDKTSTSRTKQ